MEKEEMKELSVYLKDLSAKLSNSGETWNEYVSGALSGIAKLLEIKSN